MTKLLWGIIIILIVLLAAMFFISRGESSIPAPEPIPVTPTEVPDPHADLIRVTSPTPNALVTSPLSITGEARGNWFFEASFPLRLLDANGNAVPLEPGYVMATGEWMTTDFVPFESTHTFSPPTTATGTLILQKDNPSGESQFDDSFSIPVRFVP